MKLFEPYTLGNISLKNRIVMAPMTRCRAIGNIPNDLMANYYQQRSNAGLIITEGVAPSANGLGYARIPGIYSEAQTKSWKKITDAVHQTGGKIFIQLMHTGRVSHPANMEKNTEIVAPSAIALKGEMYTDQHGLQDYPQPKEMTLKDIEQAQDEFVRAAENAIAAGFDGVELHGANGYLIDQFINKSSNIRTDNYGGSVENRCRFAIETAEKVTRAIGAERTGIRISPYGTFSGMEVFEGLEDTYLYLAKELGKLKLVYIHTVDHSAMGSPVVSISVKDKIRKAFNGTIIASGGLNKEKATTILEENKAELFAFGRPYLSNPDLVYRLKNNIELNEPDYTTFYTPGEKGYTDYPSAV
ncbi:MAG: alkene reductase [Bacteroidales bacterium]|nr:alkene reductase [Bacteroidales bacterium]MCF8404493.1 alkene reductase [Bacteroidales bacterium]